MDVKKVKGGGSGLFYFNPILTPSLLSLFLSNTTRSQKSWNSEGRFNLKRKKHTHTHTHTHTYTHTHIHTHTQGLFGVWGRGRQGRKKGGGSFCVQLFYVQSSGLITISALTHTHTLTHIKTHIHAKYIKHFRKNIVSKGGSF